MLKSTDRRREPNLLNQLPMLVKDTIEIVLASHARGLVAKAKQLPCLDVVLGMGGESFALPLTFEVIDAVGLECLRVHGVGRTIFLECKELITIWENCCVGHGSVDREINKISERLTIFA